MPNKPTINNDDRIRSRRVKLTQHRIYKNINKIILVPHEGHMLEMPIINHDNEIRYEKFFSVPIYTLTCYQLIIAFPRQN